MAGWKSYVLAIIAVGTLSYLWAAAPAVGVATAKGSFDVNRVHVSGTAPLFEGAVVETGEAGLRLDLGDGSRIDLNAHSTITVRAAEVILEQGSGEVQA